VLDHDCGRVDVQVPMSLGMKVMTMVVGADHEAERFKTWQPWNRGIILTAGLQSREAGGKAEKQVGYSHIHIFTLSSVHLPMTEKTVCFRSDDWHAHHFTSL
jgi:hypothetical protein